ARDWRRIARLAGVPDNIWSMDTRAGSISEAEEVAGLEAARKLAAHSNSKTTLGYVRNDDLENNRKVSVLRAKRRK
ncbi:MAG: integrase, partial [Pseudomonadota bacterium]